MKPFRLHSFFWFPPRVSGLLGGGLLLFLALRLLPAEGRLWNDIHGSTIVNGFTFLLGLFIMRWGLFPIPMNITQRAENAFACLLLFGTCGLCISWAGQTGIQRSPVLYLVWILFFAAVLSIPSLVSIPKAPPHTPSGGRIVLTYLFVASLLFLLIATALYPRAQAGNSDSQMVRLLLYPRQLPPINLVRCPDLQKGQEALLLIPFRREDLRSDSDSHQRTQIAIQKGYKVAALVNLESRLLASHAPELLDWWEEFLAYQARFVPYERISYIVIPFWHPHCDWIPHDKASLLAEARCGFNPGIQDHARKVLQYITNHGKKEGIGLIVFSPFAVLDDLADTDPGLQTAMNIAILPPWDWFMLCFPMHPNQELYPLTAHYTRSALYSLGDKVALIVDGSRSQSDLSPLLSQVQMALSWGVTQMVFTDIDELLIADDESNTTLEDFVQTLQEDMPKNHGTRRTFHALFHRHLNSLLDLLIIGSRP